MAPSLSGLPAWNALTMGHKLDGCVTLSLDPLTPSDYWFLDKQERPLDFGSEQKRKGSSRLLPSIQLVKLAEKISTWVKSFTRALYCFSFSEAARCGSEEDATWLTRRPWTNSERAHRGKWDKKESSQVRRSGHRKNVSRFRETNFVSWTVGFSRMSNKEKKDRCSSSEIWFNDRETFWKFHLSAPMVIQRVMSLSSALSSRYTGTTTFQAFCNMSFLALNNLPLKEQVGSKKICNRNESKKNSKN